MGWKHVAACWLSALGAAGAHADIDRSALIHLAPSVLKIEAINASGSYNLGSGVIVGEGKVVTNCHVTRNAVQVNVVKGGIRWTARSQAADLPHDLCLLQVPRLEGDAVPIGRAAELKPGQDVLAMGYTGGIGIQLSEGTVVALHQWSGSQIIQSSNWFTSGASGGALFSADGRLVGILTFRLRGGAAHYFAAPADWLLDALTDEGRYQSIQPLPGQTFWEQPLSEQPLFLQAAVLEQGRQWGPLGRLAERWSAETSADAEAPYLLGLAREGQEQPEAAISAWRRSLAIDPTYSRSLVRLAHLYKRQGQWRDMRMALATLAMIDPKLAKELSAELE